jgi:hypothetical protein
MARDRLCIPYNGLGPGLTGRRAHLGSGREPSPGGEAFDGQPWIAGVAKHSDQQE